MCSARASRAWVHIDRDPDRLTLLIGDDGVGGADPTAGTGLAGLADRVSALGGSLHITSPVGGPTQIEVQIPCGS